jgi:hypothetical protein
MRFFFHLRRGPRCIVDDEGVESASAQSVQLHALIVLEEFRAELGEEASSWTGWLLEITDAAGATIATISLDDVRLSALLVLMFGSFAGKVLQHLPQMFSYTL